MNAEDKRRLFDGLVRLCGVIALFDGVVWLALWLTGIAGTWVIAHSIVMKTNMALCLICGGSALLLSSFGRSPLRRRLTLFLATLILIIVGLTIMEYIGGMDFGIDQLLVVEPPGAEATTAPNRMGILGASCFVLVSVGLLALAFNRRRWSPMLGLAICVISVVPIVGFLFNIADFYSNVQITAMASSTVLGLLALGLGLIISVPDAGPMDLITRNDLGGALIRRLLPMVILMPLLLGYIILQSHRVSWLSGSLGMGIFVIAIIFMFTAIIWRDAAYVSRVSIARRSTEETLRQSERRLRESTEHFRQLAEFSPNLSWAARPDGWVYWYNQRWYEYTGTSLEQVEGWGWKNVHDLGLLPKTLELWHAAIVAREPLEMRSRLRDKNGNFRMFLTRIMPFFTENGEVDLWFGTHTDIEEIQRFEDELKKAKEVADSANRAKTNFIATVSHDLRTPLNAILGFSELLLMDQAVVSSSYGEQIKLIVESGRHLLNIVNGLLNLATIESGKIVLHKEEFDLKELLVEYSKSCEMLAQQKGIRWQSDVVITRHVYADRHRILEVLNNLINNAIKYTQSGGLISLRAREVAHEVNISIRDSGVGIAEEDLERIFLPFERGRTQGIDREGKSVGLGLAIGRQLMGLHGGRLTVQSKKGEGSCFTITLPTTTEDKNSKIPLYITQTEPHEHKMGDRGMHG